MPRTIAAAAALASLALAATAAVTQAAPVNVTANPAIARDLTLAAAFWDARRPDLAPLCAVQVYVGRTVLGVGNDGQVVPAVDVWAQTALGGCQIVLSAAAWSEARSAPPIGGRYGVCTIVWHGSTGTCETSGWSQFDVCNRIAHEYAHTLGLGDTAHGPRILNQSATGGDPVCAAAYYGHRPWPR
jgi:hypothetical protein